MTVGESKKGNVARSTRDRLHDPRCAVGVALQSDGSIIARGVDSSGRTTLSRYNTAGAIDHDFGPDSTGTESPRWWGLLS